MNTQVIDKLIQQATIEYHDAKDAWRNGTGTLAAFRAAAAHLNDLRAERDMEIWMTTPRAVAA